MYEIMKLPVAMGSVKDPINVPLVRLVDNRRLRFRWRLAGRRRYLAVAHRDVENVVLLDCIPKV